MSETALVERDFKLKFGLKLCLLTIAGMLAVTLFIFFTTSKNLGGTYRSAIYTIYDLKVNIFSLMFASFYSIFILIVVTVAIAAIALFFSHKMAGPVVRLKRAFDEIGSGDLTHDASLRGGDQFAPIADEINRMVRSVNHTVRSVKEALEEIESKERLVAALLDSEPGAGTTQEFKARLLELGASIDNLKRVGSSVTLKEQGGSAQG